MIGLRFHGELRVAAEHVFQLVLPEAGALAAAPVIMHAGVDLRFQRKAGRDAGGAGRGGEDLRLAGVGRSGRDGIIMRGHGGELARDILRHVPIIGVLDAEARFDADEIGRGGHARKRENGGRQG